MQEKQEDLLEFVHKFDEVVKKKKRMAKAKHVHQYERVDIGKNKPYVVYKCVLSNCTHYLPPELVIGKLSVCPYCQEVFEIRRQDLNLVKPHCENCINETARANSLQRKNIQEKEEIPASLGDKLLTSISEAKRKVK